MSRARQFTTPQAPRADPPCRVAITKFVIFWLFPLTFPEMEVASPLALTQWNVFDALNCVLPKVPDGAQVQPYPTPPALASNLDETVSGAGSAAVNESGTVDSPLPSKLMVQL